MKIVERVLERRIRTLVNLNKIQFGFMRGKRTVNAIFIVRRMQKEYQNKDKKLYMCFVEMEKLLIEWTIRKKGLSELMVQAAMSCMKVKRQE